MAKREEERRRRQASDNYINQLWRGIDMFAPATAPATHTIGVYPLVSRRGRILKNSDAIHAEKTRRSVEAILARTEAE